MTIKTFSAVAPILLATVLPAPRSLPAQEVVDLPARVAWRLRGAFPPAYWTARTGDARHRHAHRV